MTAAVMTAMAGLALAVVSPAGAGHEGSAHPPPGCTDSSPPSGEVVYSCVSEAGLLRLHLGGDDYFRYEPDSDGDGVIDTEETPAGPSSPVDQEISTTGCAASLGAPSLATLTAGPAGATLGQKKDSIGVRFNEGGGEPCAQVNDSGATGQSLTLSLGGAPEVAGKLVDWAEIDLEVKFDGVVRLEFFEGGPSGSPVGTIVVDCNPASDCGPDSADGDNLRLETNDPPAGYSSPAPFDTVVMTVDDSGPSNGAFSLEGGADGTAPGSEGALLSIDPNDTIMHLVTVETRTYEGELDCGDTDSVVVPSGGATSTSATVERVDNTASACVKVPYNLTAGYVAGDDEQFVEFDVELFSQDDAAFEWIIEWDGDTSEYPVTATTEIDFGDGNGRQPLQWCDGTYDPDAATAALRLADVEPITSPETVGGCLAYQEVAVVDDVPHVTEVIMLGQDPLAWR